MVLASGPRSWSRLSAVIRAAKRDDNLPGREGAGLKSVPSRESCRVVRWSTKGARAGRAAFTRLKATIPTGELEQAWAAVRASGGRGVVDRQTIERIERVGVQ